jgi:hypothetical protein
VCVCVCVCVGGREGIRCGEWWVEGRRSNRRKERERGEVFGRGMN